MEHEMAAVADILERLNEAGEAEPAQDDEDAWSDDDDAAAPPATVEQPGTASAAAQPAPAAEAAALAAGESDAQDPNQLQRVVMSKRLAGLQSRQRELEVGRVFSINYAVAPTVGERHGVHTGRMCVQFRSQYAPFCMQAAVQSAEAETAQAAAAALATEADGQPAGVAAAAVAAAKKAQLVEDDVFEAMKPRPKPRGRSLGGSGGGGGLVETERDRLIRTVRARPQQRQAADPGI